MRATIIKSKLSAKNEENDREHLVMKRRLLGLNHIDTQTLESLTIPTTELTRHMDMTGKEKNVG